MVKITKVKGRQVFDSRGNPTVEAEVYLDNGISATAIAPSGASTGAFEAHELRDQGKNKFLGKSVYIAVENINSKISPKLKDLTPSSVSNKNPKLGPAKRLNLSDKPISANTGTSIWSKSLTLI